MNTLKPDFEMLFPCDCKKEEDTHSWPFHSSATASSGCRTCVRPDRRSAPVPWSLRGASPSGSPSAWSSYISPLKNRPDRQRNCWSVFCNWNECVTDNDLFVCVYFHHLGSHAVIYSYTRMNTQQCRENALDTPVTADRGLLVSWEEEKIDDSERQFLHEQRCNKISTSHCRLTEQLQ